MSQYDEHMQKWADICIKFWEDEEFREALLRDPTRVLRGEGIDAGNKTITVVVDSPEHHHFVIPDRCRDLDRVREHGMVDPEDIRMLKFCIPC